MTASKPAKQDAVPVPEISWEATFGPREVLAASVVEAAVEAKDVKEAPKVKVPILAMQSGDLLDRRTHVLISDRHDLLHMSAPGCLATCSTLVAKQAYCDSPCLVTCLSPNWLIEAHPRASYF